MGDIYSVAVRGEKAKRKRKNRFPRALNKIKYLPLTGVLAVPVRFSVRYVFKVPFQFAIVGVHHITPHKT